jgi:hypothetical protein
MEKVFMHDPTWFSPLNVIHHGDMLVKAIPKNELKSKKFRKVIEAYTVAQMLVGIMVKEDREYWMQLVDDQQETPDIRTIRYADKHLEKFDMMEQVDVEVVEYESHTTLSIPEFIVDKKFSKKKSYDDNTIILCHVGSGVKAYLPDGSEVKKVLGQIKSPCDILFLAGSDPTSTILGLYTLRPEPGLLLEYNPVIELAKMNSKKKLKGVVNFKLGSRKPSQYNPDSKHYPFENLGYVPDKDGVYRI